MTRDGEVLAVLGQITDQSTRQSEVLDRITEQTDNQSSVVKSLQDRIHLYTTNIKVHPITRYFPVPVERKREQYWYNFYDVDLSIEGYKYTRCKALTKHVTGSPHPDVH